ncbi:MAG: hypothetical protein R3326_00625 [Gemmatimonadota bacterium]|nr:hypothetical protein [Gemmatimonadota bacterium]
MRSPLRRLLALVALLAITATPSVSIGQSADRWESEGDSLMRAFDTAAAIEAYRRGLENDPDDVSLLWKTSRALANRADETSGEEGDEPRYERAVDLARRAVRAGPAVSRAHTTLATALGKLALYRGGRRKVELSREVKTEAERAVELDPDDFAPFTVLGVWNREVATLNFFLRTFAETFYGGLPDASLDRSRRLLERAVSLAPDRITPHLELARTLAELDRDRAARRALRDALSLEPRETLDRVQQRRARALLEDLEG